MSKTALNRIRLKVDTARPYLEVIDLLISRYARIPRARDVQVELGIFSNDAWRVGIDDVTSITVELKDPNGRAGNALASSSIGGLELDQSATLAGWLSDSQEHGVVRFNKNQLAMDMGGSDEKPLWLVVTAETALGQVTYLAGRATLVDDGGLALPAIPPEDQNQYYTKEQIDAMFAGWEQDRYADKIIRKNGFQRVLSVGPQGQPIDNITPYNP